MKLTTVEQIKKYSEANPELNVTQTKNGYYVVQVDGQRLAMNENEAHAFLRGYHFAQHGTINVQY